MVTTYLLIALSVWLFVAHVAVVLLAIVVLRLRKALVLTHEIATTFDQHADDAIGVVKAPYAVVTREQLASWASAQGYDWRVEQ